MMLKLTQEILHQIHEHGINAYPYEGCGLLLGQMDGEDTVVQAVFPVPNRWENEEEKRERFLISDGDMLRAELAAAEKGLDVVGVFHSHPDHPPVASPRDLAWAAWPGYSYMITEVRQGRPEKSQSWQLKDDRSGFTEEQIII